MIIFIFDILKITNKSENLFYEKWIIENDGKKQLKQLVVLNMENKY